MLVYARSILKIGDYILKFFAFSNVSDYYSAMRYDALAPNQYLPPEILLDRYHPSNERFFKDTKALERALVAASQKAGVRNTQIAKMAHRGVRTKDIAKELGFAPATVSAVKRTPAYLSIVSLMEYLSQLREGPNIDHRKRTLWEIVVDNKNVDPKTAIAAMQEMNRMDGVGKQIQDTKIEVTINADLMPRGALDQ